MNGQKGLELNCKKTGQIKYGDRFSNQYLRKKAEHPTMHTRQSPAFAGDCGYARTLYVIMKNKKANDRTKYI